MEPLFAINNLHSLENKSQKSASILISLSPELFDIRLVDIGTSKTVLIITVPRRNPIIESEQPK